ncbi:P-loop containing nucleoside triphosphate hydrolase protein [Bisporella sp. PMI_857]|nr:P-loop containing nucleoside triphosphate hydrolase protein [Bisporella sp. PMI_857]
MFSTIRRGPASISKIVRASSTILRVPTLGPSPILRLLQNAEPLSRARYFHVSSQLKSYTEAQAAPSPRSTQQGPEVTKFEELLEHNLVHPNVVERIIGDMGLHTMTEVQSATINQALQGTDMIAQARTGTGKTLGFLIPTIQNILRKSPELATRQRYTRARASDIRAIIISPTRELALQIAVEADKLCAATDLRVQVAVGGNNKKEMLYKTQREGCHLLVATPGRLHDLLSDPRSGIRADGLTTLVLDEADRLLEAGFQVELDKIDHYLPDRNIVDRQTLLFSATVPREVIYMVRRTLKPNYETVETVHAGEPQTHERVPQRLVITPGIENHMPTLVELCKREINLAATAAANGEEHRPFKAIVYFNSTANVELATAIFENLKESTSTFGKHPLAPAEISEIHGQLTQNQRARVTERFRRAKTAILFSTDVTARGMDFPNVTHVIQMGLPPNPEQYVHRIGRTGRAGKEGTGYLIIPQADVREGQRLLRHMDLVKDEDLITAKLDMTRDAQLPAHAAAILSQVGAATRMVDRPTKEAAYLASISSSINKKAIIGALNQWTRYGWGWEIPPALGHSLATKLGISRVPGINIGRRDELDPGKEAALNGPTKVNTNKLPNSRGGPPSAFGSRGFGGRGGGFGGRNAGFGDRDGGLGGSRGGFGGRGDRDRGDRDRGDRDRGDGYGGYRSGRSFERRERRADSW